MHKKLLAYVHLEINQSLQVAIIDMEMEGLLQLVNPKIISQSNETITGLRRFNYIARCLRRSDKK